MLMRRTQTRLCANLFAHRRPFSYTLTLSSTAGRRHQASETFRAARLAFRRVFSKVVSVMFDISNDNKAKQERTILRELRVWIAALAVACLATGIGIGAMLSGRPTAAQPELQI